MWGVHTSLVTLLLTQVICGEEVPADLVLLATSDPTVGSLGKSCRSDRLYSVASVRSLFQTLMSSRSTSDKVPLASPGLLSQGVCHVETANLDGETNLKIKNSYGATAKAKSADDLAEFAHK